MKYLLSLITILAISTSQAETYPTEELFNESMQSYTKAMLNAHKTMIDATKQNASPSDILFYYCLRRDYLLKMQNDIKDNMNYKMVFQWRTAVLDRLQRDSMGDKQNGFDANKACKNVL